VEKVRAVEFSSFDSELSNVSQRRLHRRHKYPVGLALPDIMGGELLGVVRSEEL
jgi:hypothetical protein